MVEVIVIGIIVWVLVSEYHSIMDKQKLKERSLMILDEGRMIYVRAVYERLVCPLKECRIGFDGIAEEIMRELAQPQMTLQEIRDRIAFFRIQGEGYLIFLPSLVGKIVEDGSPPQIMARVRRHVLDHREGNVDPTAAAIWASFYFVLHAIECNKHDVIDKEREASYIAGAVYAAATACLWASELKVQKQGG